MPRAAAASSSVSRETWPVGLSENTTPASAAAVALSAELVTLSAVWVRRARLGRQRPIT